MTNPKNLASYMRGKTNRRGYLRDAPSAEQFERATLGILSSRSGERLVVKLTAALVATNASAFKRTVVDALEEGVLLIELDLSACDRADRAGLGALVSAGAKCTRHEPAVAVLITAVSDGLLAQLRHFQIDKLFAIVGSDRPSSGCATQRVVAAGGGE